MQGWQACGKVVHHRCGMTLWVRAMYQGVEDGSGNIAPYGGSGDVLVEYRTCVDGMIVYLCPGCDGPLRLWWDAGGRRVETAFSMMMQEFS
jgi:hypothetical protein